MALEITTAYARRALEYAEHLGSMTSVHPADLQLVTGWADRQGGPVIDAGCGPGHWTGYLAERGVTIRGVDLVPSFIEHARRAYPNVSFAVGDIGALPETARTVAGVLAWYSLIHHQPGSLRDALAEFARVLRPGGELLLLRFAGRPTGSRQARPTDGARPADGRRPADGGDPTAGRACRRPRDRVCLAGAEQLGDLRIERRGVARE